MTTAHDPTDPPHIDDAVSVRQAMHQLGTIVLKRLSEQDGTIAHLSRQVSAGTSHIDGRIDAMASGMQLELGGIKGEQAEIKNAIVAMGRAIDQLAQREAVTGSYMIQVAGMAGEAKGAASAARHRDSDPVKAIVGGIVTVVVKHAPVWVWRALPLIVAGGMFVLHKLGWLGK